MKTVSSGFKCMTALGSGLLVAAALGALGACALRDKVSEDSETSGVVVNINDSSNVVLTLDDDSKTQFTDSGSFDLDDIRKKMSDKGLDPDSVRITGIVVTYDDSTKSFIAGNSGVKFFLKMYLREGTGARKLALETLEKDIEEFKALEFDTTMQVFVLGKDIFANQEGFPRLLEAVKDKSVKSAWVIAELTVPGKLKTKGTLKVNMVVTVAGKV
jgi:hypothetical protein